MTEDRGQSLVAGPGREISYPPNGGPQVIEERWAKELGGT